MTRDMLIKLLATEHHLWADGDYDDEFPSYFCECGIQVDDYDEWVDHIADRILLGFAR